MRLASDVLIEIMNIVQSGLLLQEDVSQALRDLDLEEIDGELVLSEDYVNERE